MSKKQITLIITLISLICIFWFAGFGKYFTFEYLKEQQQFFKDYYALHPTKTIIGFFMIYVTITALAFIPGAAIMTLLAGVLFKTILGTIIVSFASSIGAVLAFLFSRYILQDFVKNKFSKTISKIDQGVEKEGKFYLFALRLVPIFPFFVINLVMGLTSIKTWTFYWVSQIGMFFGTIIYVYAGTQLGEINKLSDILSTELIIAFVLIGVFPFVAKIVINKIKMCKIKCV